ncbi:MAG: TolC family protein [Candidatus Omnitrophica bacterium]|nr:TolC family protein [Candidatus Omnitrophota bacterium]
MRKFFLIVLGIFIFLNLAIAEEVALTLDEVIAIALRNNSNILLKIEELKKAKEILIQSYAGVLPKLNITEEWQRTVGFYNKDISSIHTQISLQQTLYQGGRILTTISINKDGIGLARVILDKVKLEIISTVKKAFYALRLSEKLVELNKDIWNNTQAHLEVRKKRYQYGEVSRNDILNIEASLVSAQKAYEEALNQKEEAQAILRNVLFLEEGIYIKPMIEFTYEEKEIIYDKAFLDALSKRPEIREYELEESIAKKNVELRRTENRPTISVFWNYFSNSRTTSVMGSNKGWQDYQTSGITVNWPIFDGWLARHKVKQMLIELKEAQLLKEKVKKDIGLELKKAYLTLKEAMVRLKKAESEILFYKDNFLALEEKYKKGEASLLDKEDAELKFKIALFNKEEAVYDYLVAKVDFDKATGGL